MRSVLACVLASLLFFALAGAASANDDATTGTGNLQDPDLSALKQAVDEFRTKLATVAETCALTREGGDAAAAKDCAAQYKALRAELKKVQQAALALVRNNREWAKRSKQETEQLKQETEKVDAAKHDEAAMRSKSLPERIKWIDERLLQDSAGADAARKHAQDARDTAAGLAGDRLADANEVGAKWDETAARYVAEIKRLTALRAQLVAAQNAPKACASHTSTCVKEPKACASNTSSCATTREKLTQQLKSLDETIAYKRAKLADLNQLLAYKLAQADATTGEERDQWLELAQGVRDEITQWSNYLSDLLKQRAELSRRLDAVPSSDGKGCPATTSSCVDLAAQLKSVDELINYKMQKFSDAKTAGDEEAARYWMGLLNELFAERAEIVAKLNALK